MEVYIKRFLRTIIPQVPAVISYLMGVKPEWTALLTLIGAILTALDKFLRDIKWYDEIVEKIQG